VPEPRFQAVCEAAAERWEVPALAVGTTGGRVDETVAVGCPPDTRFRVASVTKPFTATLAAATLDLDAPTGVWPDDVRVRHLLAHTSGYDGEIGDLARFGDGDDALRGAVAELPGARRWLGVDEVWSYANTGYWLAGWLAAERVGSTYEDALASRVLGPAGLEATAFDEPGPRRVRPRRDRGPLPAGSPPVGRARLDGRRPPALRAVAARRAVDRGTARPARAARSAASTAWASSVSASAARTSGVMGARTAGSSRRSCSCRPTARRSWASRTAAAAARRCARSRTRGSRRCSARAGANPSRSR
jgi:CubicO group peptidase (beta-lactamase class C family)